MTCSKALSVARRRGPEEVAAHLAGCPRCRTQLAWENDAIAAARAMWAVTVPDGHADRVVEVALAGGQPVPVSGWALALPVAWRAAAALNLAAVLALTWLMVRAPTPTSTATAAIDLVRPVDVDSLLDNEADAVLARALGASTRGVR